MTENHPHRTATGRPGARAARIGAAALAAALVLAVIGGCGGTSGGKGKEAAPGETIYVEGHVSLRGNYPFPLLLFEAKDGTVYMIDTSPTAEELRNLDGMAVGVTAKVLPGVKGEAPALSVSNYVLLALPSGDRPVVGIVYATVDQGDIRASIQADDGSVWIIEGMFRTVFMDLTGAKVWIVGEKVWGNNTHDGDFRAINVTEYGVIRVAQKGIEIH
jgi:hypothetical protein